MERRLLKPKGKEKFSTDSKAVKKEKSKESTSAMEIDDENQKISKEIFFGSIPLKQYFDPLQKFRTLVKVNQQQQCLLDNIWHLQTPPQALTFKFQVLNALCAYFGQIESQSFSKTKSSYKSPFKYYVIYRGIKTGIFNNYNSVRRYTLIADPVFKGFETFGEAIESAREVLGLNFYIEPEQVKTFSEIIKSKPDDIIQSQQEKIKTLELQVIDLQRQLVQKELETKNSQYQLFEETLNYKEETIKTMEKMIQKLNKDLNQGKIEKDASISEESKNQNRTLEKFKARLIDIPWIEVMKPVLERIPDIEEIISSKILKDFPKHLISLQKEILELRFSSDYKNDSRPKKTKYKGIIIKQRPFLEKNLNINQIIAQIKNDEGFYQNVMPGLFVLQINLNETNMPDEEILKYYHNGMIDLLEFKITEKIENLLNCFGEKFLITAGNIASLGPEEKVYCKILASLPEVSKLSYRPARKRIILKEKDIEIRNLAVKEIYEIGTAENEIKIQTFQSSKHIPNFPWEDSHLVAEGHYLQIWAPQNWRFCLPFSGEGEFLDHQNNIINTDEKYLYTQDFGQGDTDHDDISIDETHRDF